MITIRFRPAAVLAAALLAIATTGPAVASPATPMAGAWITCAPACLDEAPTPLCAPACQTKTWQDAPQAYRRASADPAL